MQDDLLSLAYDISRTTEGKIHPINSVMGQARFLAINTRIEAARAGQAGVTFGVLADEIGKVAQTIVETNAELRNTLHKSTERLREVGDTLVRNYKGERLADLALNAIEIMDRNLYERSCDVRWWATDSAMVAALQDGSEASLSYASHRLHVILKSYTVYLDLFILDKSGQVIACGRRRKYPHLTGADFSKLPWFRSALRTTSGDDYAVADVDEIPELDHSQAAIYATAIREGGATDGKVLGVLGIAFDWATQAQAILEGLRISKVERKQCRIMILDSQHRILAVSDGKGVFTEIFDLKAQGARGFYEQDGKLIAYALTPGYETYKGSRWYGVIEAA